ncbi:MAG: hypothetical protein AAGA46_03525 [Cyanobacteria bacterium P01_F01_bin.13]
MNDRSRWPQSLELYFESLDVRALTVSALVDWMAQQSGILELSDSGEDHTSAVTRMGRYTRLKKDPRKSAGADVLLLSAMAHCKIITFEGRELDQPVHLARMLNGSHPFGER